MQANDLNSTPADIDVATSDPQPLAWVLGELRKSLDGSVKALKHFVRQAGSAKGYDLATLDASQLRVERKKLHQAVGALEMLGLVGPVLVLRAMEAVFQKFNQLPDQCSQDAAVKMEFASFAAIDYLECVLADKPVSPVSLFPQYRQLQELMKAARIHPADLWPMEWRWLEPELSTKSEPRNYDAQSRMIFDTLVLQIMKGPAPLAAANLKDLSLGFSALHHRRQSDLKPRIFWKLAAAYFEALALGLLPSDIYVRRASSRVLLQYSNLSKGDMAVSDRLAQDLLFFCSQASAAATSAPVLSAVRLAYGLAGFKAVDYETVLFGRFDPALLAQARRSIVAARETWSALLTGDANKFKVVVDQFSLVTDSLVKLYPPSEPLAQTLSRAVDATFHSGQPPTVELAMEVATSVLYLEAAFDHLDPTDGQLAARTRRLAERLETLENGGAALPLESWMEDLHRLVGGKQAIGSVVGELRISLGELEKSLDFCFHHPRDKIALSKISGQLTEMRGVLSVFGLDQASHALRCMRDNVEQMLETEIDEEGARAAGIFVQLRSNLGALSFLIDLLNSQPVLAKKLFVYDDVKGELRPLMGRANKFSNAAPASQASSRPVLAQIVHHASAALSGHDTQAAASAQVMLATSVALVAPTSGGQVMDVGFEEDFDFLAFGDAPVQALTPPDTLSAATLSIEGIDFESLSAISDGREVPTVEAEVTTASHLEMEALQKQFEEFEAQPLAVAADIAQLPCGTVDLQDVSATDFESLPAVAFGLFDNTAHADDEQIKVIGNLRIGIALYNVYLNEADEWSRRLLAEVSEWAMEPSLPVGDSAVSFAHSLADSSAAVGFNSLSEITRTLQAALVLSQVHYSDATAARYSGVFVNAAEDIRRLLHQFAAGFLKEPDPVVLLRLRALKFPDAKV